MGLLVQHCCSTARPSPAGKTTECDAMTSPSCSTSATDIYEMFNDSAGSRGAGSGLHPQVSRLVGAAFEQFKVLARIMHGCQQEICPHCRVCAPFRSHLPQGLGAATFLAEDDEPARKGRNALPASVLSFICQSLKTRRDMRAPSPVSD